MSTVYVDVQGDIIIEAINIQNHFSEYRNSPEIGRAMHRIVKNNTGEMDPYREIKNFYFLMKGKCPVLASLLGGVG